MTMDTPVEDGHDEATEQAKIDGIVAQMKGDLGAGHVDDTEVMLRQRFDDAGITVTDEQVDDILARLL